MTIVSVFPHVVTAQPHGTVRSIEVVGNIAVPTSRILSWMDTKPGTTFVRSDSARILAGYVSDGYLFSKVDSLRLLPGAEKNTYVLKIALNEGKRAVLVSIEMDGMKYLGTAELQSQMQTRIGTVFVPEVLERDIGSMLNLYERNGYSFARVTIRGLKFLEGEDSVGVAVSLDVNEGSLAKIRSVRVEGNTTTHAGVITRESRLTEGDVVSDAQLTRVRQRLERMQLFSGVSVPELYLNPDGTVGVLLKVTEGNPNRFDGIVGYVPAAQGTSSGYFTGLVDVQFRNILGTGRRLSARWYRETQTSQDINLQYREPWIASLPVNADAGFVQRKQDSTYIRNEYTLAAELMATDELNVGVLFASQHVMPTQGYGASVSSESRTASLGVSVSYDSRNDPVTPVSGVRYRTEYQSGVKTIESSFLASAANRSATQKLSFDLEYDYSPLRNQVLSAGLAARDFRSGSIEQSDLFRLGGANTLRGYREGQFLGSRVAWSNIEYRVLTGGRSYAFGFVDVGYILVPDRPEVGLVRQELNRTGYGAGIRLDTPLGLMSVSFAFGQGDTFSTAKLHLRLMNEF